MKQINKRATENASSRIKSSKSVTAAKSKSVAITPQHIDERSLKAAQIAKVPPENVAAFTKMIKGAVRHANAPAKDTNYLPRDHRESLVRLQKAVNRLTPAARATWIAILNLDDNGYEQAATSLNRSIATALKLVTKNRGNPGGTLKAHPNFNLFIVTIAQVVKQGGGKLTCHRSEYTDAKGRKLAGTLIKFLDELEPELPPNLIPWGRGLVTAWARHTRY